MKSWKTTTAGVVTIIGAVCAAILFALKGQFVEAAGALSAGIPSGIGLIAARDNDKTSEQVDAK
jgi:hypothetical protein